MIRSKSGILKPKLTNAKPACCSGVFVDVPSSHVALATSMIIFCFRRRGQHRPNIVENVPEGVLQHCMCKKRPGLVKHHHSRVDAIKTKEDSM